MSLPRLSLKSAIPLFTVAGLLCALVAYLADMHGIMNGILLVTLVVGTLPLLIEIAQSMFKGQFGVDLVAIVAICTAFVLGEYLAGTVVLLMLSGGEALEAYALRRARKELTALIENAPTVAHKKTDGTVIDIPTEEVRTGDLLVVKPGEIVPVDGKVVEGIAMVDESALTGEALPIRKAPGHEVLSGSVNRDAVLTIEALKPASDSKYSHIIRLVQEAEEHKAPFVRLADRYSVVFTAITFGMAALAWGLSGDPIRLLAVLVVATPCPLILATPTAFASGISVAAARGIIVKHGGVLEKLGAARSFLFDKTGTITLGTPVITRVDTCGDPESTVLSLAASVDQLSTHILARSLTAEARRRNLPLPVPTDFREEFGEGVHGKVDGRNIIVGRLEYIARLGIPVTPKEQECHDTARKAGEIPVFVATDEKVLGAVVFADKVRPNVKQLFTHLDTLGITHVQMLTGDKASVAFQTADAVGLSRDAVKAELLPEDKVRIVEETRATHPPVVMVGDGVNDAPAIAAADVGIAMGGHGSTASSEAGDIVILVDRIERVGEALLIGHRVLHIAKESIVVGIGLSTVGMVFAAFGYVHPIMGAFIQEAIDVAVILNALRVLLLGKELRLQSVS